jgi:hypothetical protein
MVSRVVAVLALFVLLAVPGSALAHPPGGGGESLPRA